MPKIDFISDINKKFGDALGYPEVDRYMRKVLWWHLGIYSLLIFTNAIMKIAETNPNPAAWRVINPTEALVSFVIALAAVLIPVYLFGKIKNHYLWRIVVTTALVVYSYLFVFISGGSIEMHFHFFIIAALIVMYADWRLGWILLVLTGLHHGILNYLQPGWVYFYGRNDLAVVSHAIPVLIMVLFTTKLSELIRGGVIALDLTNRGIVAKLGGDKQK
ncbi:MAG TPA: hypothetical protein VNA68_01075 [Candidatus Dormibacteraeota bacterium]|nr:hypothetical protein [Candidatus Dormibacteraeota bacterium]